MKEIVFVLPPDVGTPIGGYKVVYEYANRLDDRNWSVNIGYDCRQVGQRYNMLEVIRFFLSRLVSEFRKFFYPNWFSLAPMVKKLCIYKDDDFPQSDIMVATACGTASLVSKQDVSKKVLFDSRIRSMGRTYRGRGKSYISLWVKEYRHCKMVEGYCR